MKRKKGFYEKYVKRPMDFILSFAAIIVLFPFILIIAFLVRIKLGSPVIFKQERAGYKEKPFYILKFRSMTNDVDENGKLLPDELRLTKFGKVLRATSMDGYDIIGQTRKSLENRGFREVSPMNFLDNHTRFGWYSCDMRIATV